MISSAHNVISLECFEVLIKSLVHFGHPFCGFDDGKSDGFSIASMFRHLSPVDFALVFANIDAQYPLTSCQSCWLIAEK